LLLGERIGKGFADARLATLAGVAESEIRKLRHGYGLHPVYKRVDTCAAEFATDTAYMYSTYEEECESNPTNDRPKIMVLGGGPNRIGQGIEFDYCCVHAALALRQGATGWGASLKRGRHMGDLPAPTSHSLAWFVREAWPSPHTGTNCTEGILGEGEELSLVVGSESLVLFGDGIESDRLTLTWGQSVRVSRAPRALSLVDPAGLGEG